jgi:hypothetical protein
MHIFVVHLMGAGHNKSSLKTLTLSGPNRLKPINPFHYLFLLLLFLRVTRFTVLILPVIILLHN